MNYLISDETYDTAVAYPTPATRSRVPTNVPGLTALLSGGWSQSSVGEISGMQGHGTSIVAYHSIAGAQKTGTVAFVEAAAGQFSHRHARACGVNLDELVVISLDDIEEAIAMTSHVAKLGVFALVVLDGLCQGIGDAERGRWIRLLRNDGRALAAAASQGRSALCVVTESSHAWAQSHPHWLTQQLAVARKKDTLTLTLHRDPGGHAGHALTCTLDAQHAIDQAAHLVAIATNYALLKEDHGHYAFNGTHIAHGRANAAAWLIANPPIARELLAQVDRAVAIDSARGLGA